MRSPDVVRSAVRDECEVRMMASALAASLMGVALLWPTTGRGAGSAGASSSGHGQRAARAGAASASGARAATAMSCGSPPTGPSCFTSPATFAIADPRPERDPDGLFVSFGRCGPTRSLSPAMRGRPNTSSTGCRTCRRLHERTPWSPPRIAALVAATFGDLYPSFDEREIDWQARTAAAERALNEKSNDAALFETLEPCSRASKIPMSSCTPRWRASNATWTPGEGRRSGGCARRGNRQTMRGSASRIGGTPTSAASSTPCCRAKDIRPRTIACSGGG